MSEFKLIEKILVQLLGQEISQLDEIKILWEDAVIVSFQWSVRGSGVTSSAKVLKLPNGEWKILNSTTI